MYPELARLMRVKGLVILEALSSEAGEVQDVKVLRGHPLLNTAAMEAVRQWRYSPTTLNDKPVSVLATVYVNFEAKGDSDSKSLLLRMDEAGVLWEGETRLDGEQLLDRVAEVGRGAIVIKPDPKAPSRYVKETVQLLKDAGVEKVYVYGEGPLEF